MGKKVGIGIGAFLGVVIIVAVVAGVMLLQKPSAPAPPPPVPSGPSGTGPPAPPLQQQLQDVQQAIQKAQQTGEPQDITLIITEQVANEEIAKALKNQPATGDLVMRGATVYFRKGVMEMHITAGLMGITIYPKVRAGVVVQDGKPVAQNLTVEVGMVGLPAAVSDMIKKTVEDQFDALLKSFGANVTFKSVQIEDLRMVVQGTVRKV
ncbi:MAG: hypothetical protein N3E40_03250 [Dehalococcoidia bacterium]|nr:hypothetical protein [Dehalococcoidia bacterium]